jgi:hypothetical protein
VSPKSRETQGTNESVAGGADEQQANEWGHKDYITNREEQADDNTPTLMLDIPVLNVDEINLEVEDLRAHVSLRAELADLVKINVGVDIYLDKVKLDIKGLEAQALLKIKLDRVLGTLDRALGAIDTNPQILNRVVEQDVDSTPQRAEDAAGQVSEAAQVTGDVSDQVSYEAERAAGSPLDETGDEVRRTVQRAGDESGNMAWNGLAEPSEVEGEEPTGALAGVQIEEEYIDELGRIVGRGRDESGNVVEEVLNEEGDVLDPSMPEGEDRESEDAEDGKLDATDAARRKANELGVKLSDVRGTGSNGRVLVKDVERAAR